MIDFWNGTNTHDGVVWFNRFTNEYEFEKRPDRFDAYLFGKRACEDMKHLMMPKFDVDDIVTVPYDHDKKYWTVTAVRTSQIEMRAIYDLVSAKTGIALHDVPEVDMTLVKRPTQKKEKPTMDNRYKVKKILYNGPATIVYWADGEKTVVKCMDGDTFDPMAGFCAALAKRVYGSTGAVKQIIKASNYEDSQALPFQGESVKDIATRAMAMLLADVMKGD
nr:MAG TPA: hypothetical protein [Caudoviricetes sp.]